MKKDLKRRPRVLAKCGGGAMLLLTTPQASAASQTWDGSSSGDWTDVTNWNGGIPGAVPPAPSIPTFVNPADLGGGKYGNFKQGSFQAVIIPEPTAVLLGGLGLLTLLRRRCTA